MRPPYQFTSHLAGSVLSFTDFPPRGGQSLRFHTLNTAFQRNRFQAGEGYRPPLLSLPPSTVGCKRQSRMALSRLLEPVSLKTGVEAHTRAYSEGYGRAATDRMKSAKATADLGSSNIASG
jgi:hypothetical protein